MVIVVVVVVISVILPNQLFIHWFTNIHLNIHLYIIWQCIPLLPLDLSLFLSLFWLLVAMHWYLCVVWKVFFLFCFFLSLSHLSFMNTFKPIESIIIFIIYECLIVIETKKKEFINWLRNVDADFVSSCLFIMLLMSMSMFYTYMLYINFIM